MSISGEQLDLVELSTGAEGQLRERYDLNDDEVSHYVHINGRENVASVKTKTTRGDPKSIWWAEYLRGSTPQGSGDLGSIGVADLFCGPGGLAQGVSQFIRESGGKGITQIAVDQDSEATEVYAANHDIRRRSTQSVASLVDFRIKGEADSARFAYEPELVPQFDAEGLGDIDLVLAGPPCQGHSNLNNHSRRDDKRNALYVTVPAFAMAVGAQAAVIENVPSVVHDTARVVDTTIALFESAGYTVTTGVLSAADMGWPQQRRRHFLVARRDAPPLSIPEVAAMLADKSSRSAWWAISDLEDHTSESVMDQVTELSEENQSRVDWLFDNDEYDLALAERPKSHRGGTSYMSVYGRMKKDEPAQTITTGFMSPGRGRYIHPTRRRVMTAREAARLQGFPDTYRFVVDESNPPTRSSLAKWIGDAVPMPLGYGAAVSALGPGPLEKPAPGPA